MFRTEEDFKRADFDILRFGGVSLYLRPSLYGDAKAAMERLGYLIAEVDCVSRTSFLADLGQLLPDHVGDSLDSLVDTLTEESLVPDGGLAFCFKGYHRLVRDDPRLARGVLDVIAEASRYQLILGRKLLALVQTDDPSFECDGLGAVGATWNQKEWLSADRGLG